MLDFTFGERSEKSLQGVHPDLIKIARRTLQISPIDFMVIEGVRDSVRQEKLVNEGASTTTHSRHIPNTQGYACAIDIMCLDPAKHGTWENKLYLELSKYFKQAADQLSVPMEWGGDWKSFHDYGHYQLPWAAYP